MLTTLPRFSAGVAGGWGRRICNALSLLPLAPHTLPLLQHRISPQLKFLLGSCSCVGCSFLQGMSNCSSVGFSIGCRVDLPHHGLHHGLQVSLCSGAQSTSCPSFPGLGACRAVALTSSGSSLPATAVLQWICLGGLLSQLCPI